MKFISTRDSNKNKYSSAQVIQQGLADDGGLFVPESIPRLSLDEIKELSILSYQELSATILSKFLSDYSFDELLNSSKSAYSQSKFGNDPCPLVKLNDNTFSLELWHGPTCAFKDMALQIMPRLLSLALQKNNEKSTALVLVATSGDTGKAALEGYRDVNQIKICVFYPEDGVSAVQKLQMITQEGKNVNVCAVEGNFDDIQSAVKQIFANQEINSNLKKMGYFLSSANSINFGRLAPQIVYYFKSYCDLLKSNRINIGDKINVCVPTGNFGNILAAYIAKIMGLPIEKLICASNSNNILTDFLNSGSYDRNRKFHLTISPSMDILISSNLERLLYFIAGTKKTVDWMSSLNQNGFYKVDNETLKEIKNSFYGFCATEDQTKETIKKYKLSNDYLMDTHTAVAFSALNQYRNSTGDETICVVASTANPYKFAKDVYNSLTSKETEDGLSAFDELYNKSSVHIPQPLANLSTKEVKFNIVVNKNQMFDEVLKFINK